MKGCPSIKRLVRRLKWSLVAAILFRALPALAQDAGQRTFREEVVECSACELASFTQDLDAGPSCGRAPVAAAEFASWRECVNQAIASKRPFGAEVRTWYPDAWASDTLGFVPDAGLVLVRYRTGTAPNLCAASVVRMGCSTVDVPDKPGRAQDFECSDAKIEARCFEWEGRKVRWLPPRSVDQLFCPAAVDVQPGCATTPAPGREVHPRNRGANLVCFASELGLYCRPERPGERGAPPTVDSQPWPRPP